MDQVFGIDFVVIEGSHRPTVSRVAFEDVILDRITEVVELDAVNLVGLPVKVVRGCELVALDDPDVKLDGILGSAIGPLEDDGLPVDHFGDSSGAKLRRQAYVFAPLPPFRLNHARSG